ncbi:acyltransferase [Flavobacterium sp. DSR2-3-3]|uniref:acyltransferase n=1 Tax=Flavobacterium sp. DSR2-3-3 TaxID=2804632 RepID=UPI003CEFF2A0
MTNFLQKIIAKFLNSKMVFNNPYLNIRDINVKNNKCFEEATIGEKSKFYEQAEVINLQRNKGNIRIGLNTHIRGTLLLFAHGGKIDIGDNSYIGFGTQIWSANNIKIGNDVLISHNCNIIDTNSHEENYLERQESYRKMLKKGHATENVNVKSAPIIIEDHVWISFNVSVLKGVTIGKGAIVGAGSLVLKNVEPFTMVAGNPAVFIKNLL